MFTFQINPKSIRKKFVKKLRVLLTFDLYMSIVIYLHFVNRPTLFYLQLTQVVFTTHIV